jgi:hypothetical protein
MAEKTVANQRFIDIQRITAILKSLIELYIVLYSIERRGIRGKSSLWKKFKVAQDSGRKVR